MPFVWEDHETKPGHRTLRAWPYRSLSGTGNVVFFGSTAALLAIPLLAVLATPVFWGILPFMMLAFGLQWWAMRRNDRDAELLEELELSPQRLALTRHNPRGPDQYFEANPFWTRLKLYEEGGPVEDYLTLRESDREVELGAFLSPEERRQLYHDIHREIARLN